VTSGTSIGWWRRDPTEAVTATAGRGVGPVTMLLGAYLMMHLLPAAQILATRLSVHIPVVVITGLLLTASLPAVGQIGRFWQTSISKPWMTLIAVVFLAAIFGQGPGTSVPFVTEIGVRFYTLPFYCCAIARSTEQVRHLLYWTIGAAVVLLLLSWISGHMLEGRFAGLSGTQLENPNDLAFAILLVTPSLLLIASTESPLVRVLWLIALMTSTLYVLRTGSRGNFVTLLVVIGVAYVVVRGYAKVVMLAIVTAFAVLMFVLVPAGTWQRLTLITLDPSRTEIIDPHLQGALGSQISRTELQKEAIQLTERHPALGVGALMFADAADRLARTETGKRSLWQSPHNTYLQIAAENGIPALFLFVVSLGLCFRMNHRAYRMCQRPTRQNRLVPQTHCLLLMTVAFSVGALFSNSAYDPFLGILVGLSSANFLAIQEELGAPRRP